MGGRSVGKSQRWQKWSVSGEEAVWTGGMSGLETAGEAVRAGGDVGRPAWL